MDLRKMRTSTTILGKPEQATKTAKTIFING
jgi:hypothetical protein